ncbi:S41 family peptidase [Rasiella sp. SM2506]|uniref:S41 family peptidase n=1 Tax=Rasiella sp. SM2506 TaxID=3423914 RepID=UPI003D79297C
MALILCLLLLLTSAFPSFAQESTIYQPDAMQKDLLKFKTALINTHPGIYEYQTPEEFELFMNQLNLEASKPLEAKTFYKIVLKLIAKIHDAHSGAHPYKALGKVFKNQKRLPFQVFIKNQRIFIVRNMSNQSIPEGSEIISIDASLSNNIVSEMLKHYSADGISTSGMEHYLGVSYLSFSKTYPIVFEAKPTYQITYKDYNTREIVTKTVASISRAEYVETELKKYSSNSKKFKEKAFDFKINEEEKYAYLQITRFFKDSFQEPESTYPDFYSTCFKEIETKGIKYLIVDLRDNDGGKLSNAAHLLRYFVDKPFTPTNEITTKGNDEYYLETIGDTLSFNSDFGLERKANGDYKVTNSDYLTELKVFEPIEKYGFDGKIIVLIDGGASSAGGAGPAILQEYTDAVFIGSETFGTAGVGNGINKTYIYGEYTEVAISIPLMHSDIAINEHLKRRGVLPDYEITNSIHNIINDRDVILEFAVEKLFEKKD